MEGFGGAAAVGGAARGGGSGGATASDEVGAVVRALLSHQALAACARAA